MQSVELVGRLLIALAVVLGVIWLIARKARGGARQKLNSDKLIDILGRQSLSRNSSMAVVRVANQALIIGITDTNIRVLGELELDAAAAHIAAADHVTRTPRLSRTSRTNVRSNETTEYDEFLAASGTEPASGLPQAGSPTAGSLSDIDELRTRRRDAAGSVIPGSVSGRSGRLGGSALSPATWKQTIDALREMTARKG
ncbi:MAG: flagellar biosynthetic protein FliO [Nakamurella sp.]